MAGSDTDVGSWLRLAQRRLLAAGIESARIEAQLMAAHVVGKERAWVLAHPEAPIDTGQGEALLARREQREPLAYILGDREFYGRSFRVTSAVLIPRQETETLITECLQADVPEDCRVFDIGTGSGCLAITLKLERPRWHVTGADISEEALAVARENAAVLGADVRFVLSDLFQPLTGEVFDVIVTNPPYIADSEPLMPEVAEYEPPTALYAGATGLEFYGRLAREAIPYLSAAGRLLMETGQTQAGAVSAIFIQNGWTVDAPVKDLSGVDRVVIASRPSASRP